LREYGALDHEGMWNKLRELRASSEDRGEGIRTAGWVTNDREGDIWLVRSSRIHIQARCSARGWIREVVIGGPFMSNHKLMVSTDDSRHGRLDDVKIMWDGAQILPSLGSEFREDGFVYAHFDQNLFYKEVLKQHSPTHWRSFREVRSLEATLGSGVQVTVNMVDGKSVGSILDVFITMPVQADGQDGQCGKAQGDFEWDRQGAAVAAEDSLLTPRPNGLSLSAISAHNEPAGCESATLSRERERCAETLNKTGAPMSVLFVDACAVDVCAGGAEMIDHVAHVSLQAYYKMVAPALATENCQFVVKPWNQFFWDPSCYNGKLGCLADGRNVECRFCGGKNSYASIPCPQGLLTR